MENRAKSPVKGKVGKLLDILDENIKILRLEKLSIFQYR